MASCDVTGLRLVLSLGINVCESEQYIGDRFFYDQRREKGEMNMTENGQKKQHV